MILYGVHRKALKIYYFTKNTIKKKVDGNKGIIDESKWNRNSSPFKERLSIIIEGELQITEDRKKCVTDLYFNQHKTYAEIAEIEHISPRDINAIIKEEEVRRQKYKLDKQQQEISSKAYKLFSEGKKPIEAAIELNLRESEVTKLFMEYCKLNRLHILNSIYKQTDGKLGPFLKLYRKLIKEKRYDYRTSSQCCRDCC